jgi:hypothetical protein
MLNRKMFYQIADIIEENPERWNQDSWIDNETGWIDSNNSAIIYNGTEYQCGTTQCVAGWAVLLNHEGLSEDGSTDGALCFNDDYVISRFSCEDWISVGARVLGLSEKDAAILFQVTDIEYPERFDMPRVLREIADGRNVYDAVLDGAKRCDYGCNMSTVDGELP